MINDLGFDSVFNSLLFFGSGGHFMNTAEKIRLPDDCTIGYIIESVLGVKLIRSNLFHSHLENLHQVPQIEIPNQVRSVPSKLNLFLSKRRDWQHFAMMLIEQNW